MRKKLWASVLIAGTFIILNVAGCSKGGDDNPTTPGGGGTNNPPASDCSGIPGPLFSAVRTLVEARCITCHSAGNPTQGINFSEPCNIVNNKNGIKSQAVDQSRMPPSGSLSQSDKDKITAWINAGGKITN